MCTLFSPRRVLSSMPGTSVRPVPTAAAEASAQPAVLSWSVRATVSSPARTADAINAAGASVPSDTLE